MKFKFVILWLLLLMAMQTFVWVLPFLLLQTLCKVGILPTVLRPSLFKNFFSGTFSLYTVMSSQRHFIGT